MHNSHFVIKWAVDLHCKQSKSVEKLWIRGDLPNAIRTKETKKVKKSSMPAMMEKCSD